MQINNTVKLTQIDERMIKSILQSYKSERSESYISCTAGADPSSPAVSNCDVMLRQDVSKMVCLSVFCLPPNPLINFHCISRFHRTNSLTFCSERGNTYRASTSSTRWTRYQLRRSKKFALRTMEGMSSSVRSWDLVWTPLWTGSGTSFSWSSKWHLLFVLHW
jgi:hypothetical protein